MSAEYEAEALEVVHKLTFSEDVQDVRITIYIAFVAFSVLVWDHLLTFGDEVRYIWFGRKGPLIYLFFINRYFIPLSFVANLVAYSSNFSPETCKSFVPYEGACALIGYAVTSIMMLIRVRALYADRPRMTWFAFPVLLVELSVSAWLLSQGQAVKHTQGVFSCSLIFDPDLRFWASSFAWLPLLYNTIILALTLWRCIEPFRANMHSQIVRNVLRDGILYYLVILSTNIVFAVMIVCARDGLKNVAAQLAQLLTATMMSRITINIKRDVLGGSDSETQEDSYLNSGLQVGQDDTVCFRRWSMPDPHAQSGVSSISHAETLLDTGRTPGASQGPDVIALKDVLRRSGSSNDSSRLDLKRGLKGHDTYELQSMPSVNITCSIDL